MEAWQIAAAGLVFTAVNVLLTWAVATGRFFGSISRDLVSLDGRINGLSAKIEHLETRLDERIQNVDRMLEERRDAHRADMERLESAIKASDQRRHELDTKMTSTMGTYWQEMTRRFEAFTREIQSSCRYHREGRDG